VRTADELSIVCLEESVPAAVRREGGWRALKVEGPLAFEEVGILAELTGALADAAIPTFALSTFDTDYLLVKEGDLAGATEALRGRGHGVEEGRAN
jgi:hypothetical protein